MPATSKDSKFNVAQVPRVDTYRGFIFATLNVDAPTLLEYLGPITKPIDEWLDRQPGGQIAVCEANRLRYKGNWKLAYDNSGDGYHVVFSHRSLLEMENRQANTANKGMSYYKGSPDTAPMYMAYMGHGHHFKEAANIQKRAGGLWAVEGPCPVMRASRGWAATAVGGEGEEILDLASSEPVNINVFPNFSLLGNHIQVFESDLGRRDQCHRVRHRRGGWRRRLSAGSSMRSMRCACALRSSSRFWRSG